MSHCSTASPGCHGTSVYDAGSGTAIMSGSAGLWPIGPAAKPAKPAPPSSTSSAGTAATRRASRHGSADDQHRAVGQVDHLVRGAAEDGPGQVAPAAGAHHDHVHVVLRGVLHDLAGGVAEGGVPDLPVGLHAQPG